MNTDEKSYIDSFARHRAAREARARYVAATVGRAVRGLARLIARQIFGRIHAYLQRRRQLEILLNMDDRMLRDMGLSRGGISYALEKRREADPANINTPVKKPHAA